MSHYCEVYCLKKSKCHGQIQGRAVIECRYPWSRKEIERRLEWGIWMLRKQKQFFTRVPCPWAVCRRGQVGLVESPKYSQQNPHQEVNIPATLARSAYLYYLFPTPLDLTGFLRWLRVLLLHYPVVNPILSPIVGFPCSKGFCKRPLLGSCPSHDPAPWYWPNPSFQVNPVAQGCSWWIASPRISLSALPSLNLAAEMLLAVSRDHHQWLVQCLLPLTGFSWGRRKNAKTFIFTCIIRKPLLMTEGWWETFTVR